MLLFKKQELLISNLKTNESMNSSIASQSFSFYRFLLVFKRFYFMNQFNWMIGILGIAGLLFTFWLLPVIALDVSPEQYSFSNLEFAVTFLYVLGGFILTSRLFHEVHSPSSAFQFLTLPATNFEKFLASWAISSIGYTVIAMFVIVLLSLLIEIIIAIQLGTMNSFSIFNPFGQDNLDTMQGYFYYQCIFFLGAIYFKKNNFLKTLLSIIVFVLIVLFSLAMFALFLSLMYSGDFSFQIDLNEYIAYLPWYLSTIIGLLFMAFILFLSYQQIKNKQVA